MANMASNTLYKHRTFCYQGDQVGVNTRYFLVVSVASGPITELQFITKLDTVLAAVYKPCLTNNAQYVGSDIQNITGALPYPTQVNYFGNQGIGTGGGNPLPAQVSGVIGSVTGITGRAYRGRQYIPFPDQTFVAVGPPPTASAAYAALLADIGLLTSGNLTVTSGGASVAIAWCLYHRATSTTTLITNALGRQSWGTQKRRGDYGRTNLFPTI